MKKGVLINEPTHKLNKTAVERSTTDTTDLDDVSLLWEEDSDDKPKGKLLSARLKNDKQVRLNTGLH